MQISAFDNYAERAGGIRATPVPQVVVVMNSFNRRDLLVRAAESLLYVFRSGAMELAIVVFEAGSRDGSVEWLAQFKSEHPYLRIEIVPALEGKSASFAAGVNQACRYALEAFPETEFLLLFETDNWISGPDPLVAGMRLLRGEASLAAVGFTVRLHSGEPCGYGCAFPTVLSFVLGPHLAALQGASGAEAKKRKFEGIEWFLSDVVYTSPLLIRASAWRESGGIDEELFPFSDSDLDWAWNVSRRGYLLGVLVTDAVVHDNLEKLSGWSSMRVVNFHQARFRLLRKYRGVGVALVVPALFLRHLVEYLVLIGLVLARRRTMLALRKRWMLLVGVWHGYSAGR